MPSTRWINPRSPEFFVRPPILRVGSLPTPARTRPITWNLSIMHNGGISRCRVVTSRPVATIAAAPGKFSRHVEGRRMLDPAFAAGLVYAQIGYVLSRSSSLPIIECFRG